MRNKVFASILPVFWLNWPSSLFFAYVKFPLLYIYIFCVHKKEMFVMQER